MHHPGCWVTNNGCATQAPHKVTPVAQAYSSGRPIGGPAPHPGEGTRLAPEAPAAPAVESPPSQQVVLQRRTESAGPHEEWPVIGGQPVPARVQRQREGDGFVPPSAPRRYVPPAAEQHPARKPLPKIYTRHRIIEYWYVPAAVAVAIITALAVIWALGTVFGGGDSPAPADSGPTPAATVQVGGASPAASVSVRPSASVPAGTTTPGVANAKFKPGDTAVVTGAGDCLNVRVAPGRTNAQGQPNPAIVCLNDGTEVRVITGPESAGDLMWWKVSTTLGEGWAAEDYLARKP